MLEPEMWEQSGIGMGGGFQILRLHKEPFLLRPSANKGEFRARPISRFVYILALSQSECVNRYFVNKDW